MQHAITRSVLLALTMLLVAACGAREVRPGHDPEGTPLQVTNHSWSDVRIFVVTTAGQRTRLGTVTGSSSTTLQIPASVVGGGRELQIEALPIGTRSAATSFPLFVRPGETVGITIPPQVR
jgi:hypothetical protein